MGRMWTMQHCVDVFAVREKLSGHSFCFDSPFCAAALTVTQKEIHNSRTHLTHHADFWGFSRDFPFVSYLKPSPWWKQLSTMSSCYETVLTHTGSHQDSRTRRHTCTHSLGVHFLSSRWRGVWNVMSFLLAAPAAPPRPVEWCFMAPTIQFSLFV